MAIIRNNLMKRLRYMNNQQIMLLAILVGLLNPLSGCSMAKLSVRASLPLMQGSLAAMNQETDLDLAKTAMPANLMMVEGLIETDPDNVQLRLYAAQGLYSYAYGFIEDDDPKRASALYRRGLRHAQRALQLQGLNADILHARRDDLERATAKLDKDAVPALFWGASCLAKWIYMSRDDPEVIALLGQANVLMNRVLQLDENYYFGGAHAYFGAYYGGLAPMFGGDYARSRQHFDAARRVTSGRLLIVDVLLAEYLARQTLDLRLFHDKLSAVIAAPPDLYPEMALANRIAQQKAKRLLDKEKEWF
jgi:hypothetical protein